MTKTAADTKPIRPGRTHGVWGTRQAELLGAHSQTLAQARGASLEPVPAQLVRRPLLHGVPATCTAYVLARFAINLPNLAKVAIVLEDSRAVPPRPPWNRGTFTHPLTLDEQGHLSDNPSGVIPAHWRTRLPLILAA
jgi:hypothetical protein